MLTLLNNTMDMMRSSCYDHKGIEKVDVITELTRLRKLGRIIESHLFK